MAPFSAYEPKDLKNTAKGCKKQNKTLKWLKVHTKTAHPQCTFNGKDQSVTVERKSRERKSPGEEELEATADEEMQPANNPSVYRCSKCPRT